MLGTQLCVQQVLVITATMIVYVGLSDREQHLSDGPVSLSHLGLLLSKFQVTPPGVGPNSALAAQLGQGGAVNLCYLHPLYPKTNNQF